MWEFNEHSVDTHVHVKKVFVDRVLGVLQHVVLHCVGVHLEIKLLS
mgnify:CR=1 FL=1